MCWCCLPQFPQVLRFLEVVVSFAVNTFKVSRAKASVISAALITCLGIPCALSFGIWSDIKIAGRTFFDLGDYLVSNVSLPIGGILACIFIGWVWKRKNAEKEVTNDGKISFKLVSAWSVLVKFVLPVVIFIIFVTSNQWIKNCLKICLAICLSNNGTGTVRMHGSRAASGRFFFYCQFQ